MKYQIEYFNIQGFLGYHIFTLSKGINSISSKYNGTGKSTLFDCLRLLAVRGNHEKDDLFYMINHDALEAFFRVTNEHNEVYGFYLNKEKGSFLYTRQLPEEGVQYSEYAFPEMWEKLNLFVKNNNYVNIADRFIDLFSSSNVSFNSGLVRELMLHEETEKVYEELISRMGLTKEEMSCLFAESNTLMAQRDLLPRYQKLDELSNIIGNDELIFNYETLESVLQEISLLQKELPYVVIDYSYTHLFKIQELIGELITATKEVDLSNIPVLTSLSRLQQDTRQLLPVNKEIPTPLIATLNGWYEISTEAHLFEEELPFIPVPRYLLPLLRLSESVFDLQEEKAIVDIDKHETVALFLINIQQLVIEIQEDKETELFHQKEYEDVQEQLVGLTCPTCKQIIGEVLTKCEHLS